MFSPDIISLRQFYATPLGEAAQKLIAKSIHSLWPDAAGDSMLAVGYAIPYLDPYLARAQPLIVCMPAQQGALYWPLSERGNCVFMAHESELPMQENSINRILLVHSIENSEQLSWMMQELWRVLTPGGRVLAVVPNRLGFWSRLARTPFGYGRPFSMAQLRDLLCEHNFNVTRSTSALFIPPTHLKFLWRIAPRLERIGKFICNFLGGVLLIEAEKQLYSPIKQPVMAKKTYRVPAPAKPVSATKTH